MSDLARRDFTVNAMAVDLASGALLDPHGGEHDLERKLVRMVKAANFDEDPLRLLKGVRMAVTLHFEIEAETLDAIATRAHLLARVPVERVTFELGLILSAGALGRAVTLLRATRLDGPLGLALQDVAIDDVPLAAALAILVPDPRSYGERWRWSESLIRETAALVSLRRHHDRIALFHAGDGVAGQLPALLAAVAEVVPLDFPDFSIVPFLNGKQIAEATGLEPGPELGALKRALLEAQVMGEVTTPADAVTFIRARAAR